MVDNHYRWDFIGLSTDSKPTAASEKVVDGSTYYEADTSKLYVWCDDQWYEKEGGGTEYEDFIGTDGTAAGTAGLVPAPETTDAGKFLNASGDWEAIASGSGVKVLTTNDYNYPEDEPTGVALWLLDDGYYMKANNSVEVYANTRLTGTTDAGRVTSTVKHGNFFLISTGYSDSNKKYILSLGNADGSSGGTIDVNYGSLCTSVNKTTGVYIATNTSNSLLVIGNIVDSLSSTRTDRPLSANQGKALNDKFGGMQLVQLTQAQYDALATKDANTLYIIKAS